MANEKKGMMFVLSSPSGAGKTTIVDLILGLYEHNNGEILVDNIQIEKINLRSYRNSIGYVPQDPQLFNVSIRENLLWSAPSSREKPHGAPVDATDPRWLCPNTQDDRGQNSPPSMLYGQC